MLRRVALLRTDVSEEPSAYIIRVTRICEIGSMLAQYLANMAETYPAVTFHTLSSLNVH
jgi:CRP-like cAMP-binding protein